MMDFDADGGDTPAKFRFRTTGVEYMLASDVARLLGKPLSQLFSLYPSLSRRKASIAERGYLADTNITNTAVVSLVKASEVDELLLRKTSATNPFATVPKASVTPRPDKGFILTTSEHVMPREETGLTGGAHHKKSENVIAKLFAKPGGVAGTRIATDNLVPIRLNIDHDAYKVKDTFIWNVDDKVVLPKTFAIQYCHDDELPNTFVDLITDAITAQIDEFQGISGVNLGARSVTIRLNVPVGTSLLQDQFFWSHNESTITPESFAEILCADLGIAGEFPGLIAHSIREQLFLDRKAALQEDVGDYTRPFHIEQLADCFRIKEAEMEAWSPMLSQSTWAEIDKSEKEADREARRRKRTQEDLVTNVSGRRSARARRDVSYVQSNRSNTARNWSDTLLIDPNDKLVFPSIDDIEVPPPSEAVERYLKKRRGINLQTHPQAAKLTLRNESARNTTNPVFAAASESSFASNQPQPVGIPYTAPVFIEQHTMPQQKRSDTYPRSQSAPDREDSSSPIEGEDLSFTGFNRRGYYKDNAMNRKLNRVGQKKQTGLYIRPSKFSLDEY
eukprot:m.193027 g.193027  ORF g.193027 m.193027 type:complete len:561 (+) comp32490_c0_seq1:84-1766(+)